LDSILQKNSNGYRTNPTGNGYCQVLNKKPKKLDHLNFQDHQMLYPLSPMVLSYGTR